MEFRTAELLQIFMDVASNGLRRCSMVEARSQFLPRSNIARGTLCWLLHGSLTRPPSIVLSSCSGIFPKNGGDLRTWSIDIVKT